MKDQELTVQEIVNELNKTQLLLEKKNQELLRLLQEIENIGVKYQNLITLLPN